jgi:hypothetical protein
VGTPEQRRSARLARAYTATSRRFEQGKRGIEAVFRGAWLGVLDRDALAQVDAAYYAAHREGAHRYTEPEHIRSGLADWEATALREHFPPGGRVVITSAGAGREVAGARALGFDAVGFEPHEGLVTAGRAVLGDGALQPCARDGFPAGAGRADGVVVGWGGYSHVQGRERRVAFLRGARDVLPEGAPLLVSFWMLPGSARYLRTVHAAASLVRRATGGEPVEPGDLLSPIYVHCFGEDEIRAECAAAGFAVAAFSQTPYPHAVARAV